jgi:hypothetical protein
MARFQTPIVEKGLLEVIDKLGRQTYNELGAIVDAILPLSHQCWTGKKSYMTRRELMNCIESSGSISDVDRQRVMAILSGRAG